MPPSSKLTPDIEEINYQPQKQHTLGVEVLTLSDIRLRAQNLMPQGHLLRLQRLKMAMFVLYTKGKGVHSLDFQDYSVRKNSLLFVPLHSVHRFATDPSTEATVLAISPLFIMPERLIYLKPLLTDRQWLTFTQLSTDMCDDFLSTCQAIQAEQARYANDKHNHPWLSAMLHQHMYTWLLRLRLFWEIQGLFAETLHPAHDVLYAFKKLIEKELLSRWSIQDYAKKLGYAERTLTRACLSVEGKSAKTILDERLLLEAKRHLVHSNETIEAIAFRLGFPSASNFVQFFKRLSHNTPLVFRSEQLYA